MQNLGDIIIKWAITKIAEYKIDNLKMTIDEAKSSELYASRLSTIAFLEQEITKRLNSVSVV